MCQKLAVRTQLSRAFHYVPRTKTVSRTFLAADSGHPRARLKIALRKMSCLKLMLPRCLLHSWLNHTYIENTHKLLQIHKSFLRFDLSLNFDINFRQSFVVKQRTKQKSSAVIFNSNGQSEGKMSLSSVLKICNETCVIRRGAAQTSEELDGFLTKRLSILSAAYLW